MFERRLRMRSSESWPSVPAAIWPERPTAGRRSDSTRVGWVVLQTTPCQEQTLALEGQLTRGAAAREERKAVRAWVSEVRLAAWEERRAREEKSRAGSQHLQEMGGAMEEAREGGAGSLVEVHERKAKG